MEKKLNGKTENERRAEELAESVINEFKRRQKERLFLERQWELNLNFLKGNQYCGISRRGDIIAEDKEFFWQSRGVFNHIAPIIESRLAKLARVSPSVYVRPATDDDEDVKNAQAAEKLISETFKNCAFEEKVKETTAWSEICGTGFYKAVWKSDKGKVVGNVNGEDIKEGDAEIVTVSPFEIFPDNLYAEDVERCGSIMQAKAVPVSFVKERYGVDVVGEEIGVYDLSQNSGVKKDGNKTVKNAVIIIEE